ncbi:Stage 0 sporulation protein J [[Clostridium] ultunense Esp]|uniref:Site-specific DNA-binding protein n=1 Tax=[Clostridium] ultunense Esp TaxID=1288971 RepID=M1ZLC1_9FIRM|nr:ParB/RepB/Spo0J family partition protein [Schnuerera ultunensis]CCQ96942.1 Stage 0 sporulation protein J [[Clostridium] ultunense Esp]SHD78052.1 site-specific DNA-binding protein [[Clostridium] ultunense Esp]
MVSKKRGLGKGLAALIPNEPIADLLDDEMDLNNIQNIKLSSIIPNEEQPRKDFDKGLLEELTDSIKQYGVIQPIVVRKKGNSYEIVAGERRWRAAKAANFKEIPCIVKNVDDRQAMKLALIENLQRDDLNPIEEAYAFKGLIEEHNLTQEEVASAIGKSRSYIANSIRLLNLDEEIIDYIANGKITSGHGRALLTIKDKEERIKTAQSIINNKINVRETEKMAKNNKEKNQKRKETKKDPFVKEIEEQLMRALGTKVSLNPKKEGGTIQIEFYGHEDLERILELMIK